MEIRRLTVIKDVISFEGGLPANKPVTRVAACAVIANPLAGRAQDDVEQLLMFGDMLGERLVHEALALLPNPAISYGKAAIVGTSGDIEHAAALLHPRLGKPMRAPSAAAWRSFRPMSRSARSETPSTFRSVTRTTSGRSISSIRSP
jgi:Amino acid synthesis